MAKAKENLRIAEIAFAERCYNACANRSYYSMFQAAVAALESIGLTPESDMIEHGWLQATFTRELIHRRKIYPGFENHLLQAQAIRNVADYSKTSINERKASRILRWAREYVDAVRKELKDL
ncbi:HEPN domain-containing protein [Candidatus Poribacteria bacterium]|nr:HEPN domain-containing protein [Candidatus Poribacteria bacterium]